MSKTSRVVLPSTLCYDETFETLKCVDDDLNKTTMLLVTVINGTIIQHYGRRADCWLAEGDRGTARVFR